jgi:hypothetical protein
MTRKSMLVLGPLVLALILVAAGCGGGGKKNTAATTEAVTTQAATTEAATTTAAATTTEASTTSDDLSALSNAKNCTELAQLGQKFSAAFSGAAASQDLKKEADLLQQFAAKAPSDIRGDFKVIADYFSKVADAMGNYKAGQTPDAKTIAKLQKLSTSVDQTKLQAASQHIATWVSQKSNCHA